VDPTISVGYNNHIKKQPNKGRSMDETAHMTKKDGSNKLQDQTSGLIIDVTKPATTYAAFLQP